MSDPTAVREGLPPCQKFALMDGRVASLIDKSACDIDHNISQRFWVVAGMDGGAGRRAQHPEHRVGHNRVREAVLTLRTDDPDEAQAAFNKGAEWVRTGEGP